MPVCAVKTHDPPQKRAQGMLQKMRDDRMRYVKVVDTEIEDEQERTIGFAQWGFYVSAPPGHRVTNLNPGPECNPKVFAMIFGMNNEMRNRYVAEKLHLCQNSSPRLPPFIDLYFLCVPRS